MQYRPPAKGREAASMRLMPLPLTSKGLSRPDRHPSRSSYDSKGPESEVQEFPIRCAMKWQVFSGVYYGK